MNSKAKVYPDIDLDTFTLDIPDGIQRPINEFHVNEILTTVKEFVRNGMGTPLPLISIARCPEGGLYKFYIIDGQHRYRAYKNLYQDGFKFKIDIHVIECVDINEVKKFYDLCNKRMEHANTQLAPLDNRPQYIKDIHLWINHIDRSKFFSPYKCNRPKILVSKFIDKYEHSSVKNQHRSFNDFHSYLINTNEKFKEVININKDYFMRMNGVTDKMMNEAVEINWYLGLTKDLTWLF